MQAIPETDINDEQCEQCGLCCKIFGDNISPTPMNLYHWIENGRVDILRFFTGWRSDGSRVNCAELKSHDLGDIISIEMRDPESGGYLPVCPFLRRIKKRKYICAIHERKPEMCINFMPWIRRQTGFEICKALKKETYASFLEKSGK
ncbi:MAG TPA: YkgJ family cysteine cluster protein [Methanoregulaceae archaeon]|nr:YkgJ family cysteine cluster protein [Methanoregulaceae archaeon]